MLETQWEPNWRNQGGTVVGEAMDEMRGGTMEELTVGKAMKKMMVERPMEEWMMVGYKVVQMANNVTQEMGMSEAILPETPIRATLMEARSIIKFFYGPVFY